MQLPIFSICDKLVLWALSDVTSIFHPAGNCSGWWNKNFKDCRRPNRLCFCQDYIFHLLDKLQWHSLKLISEWRLFRRFFTTTAGPEFPSFCICWWRCLLGCNSDAEINNLTLIYCFYCKYSAEPNWNGFVTHLFHWCISECCWTL